ncbi:MAG: fused MFS/spermidine synthase [Nitrospirae bacterium]|nr:fused MFS/spermidine synthase [Nitrospirota bacterium]NTW64769.1 fused MFS/spermidine synthase [Nitrospirota bacterium]
MIFLIIFTASGFSGLIYESIWTQYLKLFLGHAAYAQTLVLAIFMGGMALGSWLSSRYAVEKRNLLISYAVVEGVIGFFALVFHNTFDQAVQLSYTSIIPSLSSTISITVYKWTLSTLMILPQSILLGMTFPLMSAGIIRLSPHDPGRTLSLLYFTNSIGAAIGVLVSGFLLIRILGLPWTIRFAGIINIALAVSVYLLMKRQTPAYAERGRVDEQDRQRGYPSRRVYVLFLLVSLITGLASFIYEIGWIRMLSLVLGSSTHAFEVMLSSFISGLAFGSLWMRRRIDRLANPERSLSHIQIMMGLCALSTLPVYGYTFGVMQWLMQTLGKTEGGYVLYNLSSNAIALAVMLPTTFCAGMTLPLITLILLKRGYGEKSIGTVYAANTVGAIMGVFLAVHFGMPMLGLKGLLIFGASLDIALGVVILWSAAKNITMARPVAVTIACALAIAGTAFAVTLDPYEMASGVYRHGKLLTTKDTKILYHKDGKTATVSLALTNDGVLSIRTNGKVDAGIRMRSDLRTDPFPDESTMVLLAMLPLAMHPEAEEAAIIGFGSGLTTHTVLSSPRIDEVDTVEIERYMLEASKHFRPRVELAYTDPRSKIYIDDAKTFFVRHKKKYDMIISEPSNPWVSGVAGLFSIEFYRQINNHLAENGLFVQWIQLYEIDTRLVVSVLKAITENFSDFSVYAANDGDIIIIAKKTGSIPKLDSSIFEIPWVVDILKGIKIESIQDLQIRHIGNKDVFSAMLESFPVRANSDYFPVLDQNASRARYLQANAQDLIDYAYAPLPTMEMLTHDEPSWNTTAIQPAASYYPAVFAYAAMALHDYSSQGSFDKKYANVREDLKEAAVKLRRLYYDCRSTADPVDRFFTLFYPSSTMLPYLTPSESDAVWKNLESGPCAAAISAREKKWIGLFKAVGRRDAGTMASEARWLLENELQMPPVAEKYLVAAGMLGSLAKGDKEGAHGLWSLYQQVLFVNKNPDVLFRILAAQSTLLP